MSLAQPRIPESDLPAPSPSGAVQGGVRLWLRLEGLAALVLAVYLYARGGHSWGLFALLFFTPDLSFAGYLAGPRAGATVYNVAHSYVVPTVLAILWLATGRPPVPSLIWIAHIGFDRVIGYGLKYPSGFAWTHLGRIGRARESG
jgi:hypothetical protein